MTAELVLQRDLDAPPERVWRALTDPAALTAWFWPPRLEPAAEVDLAGEDAETLVTVELVPSGEGGTGLALRHEGFADDATRDDHIQGWTDCLDRLPDWLASARR